MSHSRKGYSEATFTQTTDDFLRALENAFRHFGGVPQTLVIDNLKAAVAHPDWFDPELTPKVQSFARHYGTVILPTKPYTPRHKGKVEAGVKYVQEQRPEGAHVREPGRRATASGRVGSDGRRHADSRHDQAASREAVRGRTRQRSCRCPPNRSPTSARPERKVNRDGHVEVAKAYYSVPPEYLGRTVWVRWDTRLVRIFNRRWEQVAVHVRHEQGRFSTHGEHLVAEKINGLERGATYLLGKVQAIGSAAHDWAQAMLTARGIEGTRVLQGLLSLAKKQPTETLENGLRHRPVARGVSTADAAATCQTPSAGATAAAVPRRASAHSSARRLRAVVAQHFAEGDPSPRGSSLRGRRFCEAWLGRSRRRRKRPRRFTPPRSCGALDAPSIRLSLVGLPLSRARLRFTGRFQRSSPFPVARVFLPGGEAR